ncbi:MAG: MFS transporter [Dehalococcoidia bacterium]|nr:MFS transporter [Dehalococcoidia bacterium]
MTAMTATPGAASMERRVITSAALAHGMTHTLELTFAALLLRIGSEFGASLATLGGVAFAGTLTFGMAALPAGYLSDRFGPRAVIAGAMFAASACALLVAFAPSLPVLAVALAILGGAIGLYHPPGTAMVSTVFERRGRAFAIHGIAGNLGISAAPLIASAVAVLVNWRAAYVLLALLALGVALMTRLVAPDRFEAARRAREAASAAQATARGGAKRRSTPPAVRSWTAPPLLLVYAATIGTGFVYRGALTFLPTHLEEHLGLSFLGWTPQAIAGAMSSLVLFAAVFGQIAGGMMSDRMSLERAAVPIVVLLVPALVLVSLSSGVVLVLAAAMFGLVNFAQQPVFNGLVADYAPTGSAGRAFGISFFLSFGLGSSAAWLAGVVAERWGTSGTFAMLAGIAVALSVVAVALVLSASRRSVEAPSMVSVAAGD